MTTVTEDLKEQLSTLPRESREELVAFLLETLEDGFHPSVEKEWLEELDRREEEMASGKVVGVPFEEMMRKLEEKYP